MELRMRCAGSELVSLKEAQKILNVRKKELFQLIDCGKLISHKKGAKIEIERESLIAVKSCTYERKSVNQNCRFADDCTSAEIDMISDWT